MSDIQEEKITHTVAAVPEQTVEVTRYKTTGGMVFNTRAKAEWQQRLEDAKAIAKTRRWDRYARDWCKVTSEADLEALWLVRSDGERGNQTYELHDNTDGDFPALVKIFDCYENRDNHLIVTYEVFTVARLRDTLEELVDGEDLLPR